VVASVWGRRGDWNTTELPRQQGLFECRAWQTGNQLVAAEELLNLTQLQQHIQDTYSIKLTESLMSYLLLRASVGKRKNPTQKDPGLVKKTRNSCPTQTMAAGNSSRKNECVFPWCHLYGDVCGYIWGKSNRQVKYDRERAPSKLIMGHWITLITSFGSKPILGLTQNIPSVFWTTYKPSVPVNRLPLFGTEQVIIVHRKWKITTIAQCLWTTVLATHLCSVCSQCSEQNPVEDVWLQAKRFLTSSTTCVIHSPLSNYCLNL